MRGEFFVTGRNCRGPGAEGGEALARVNTAEALLGERCQCQGPEPRPSPLALPHRPLPHKPSPQASAPPHAEPCWRRGPGSAASQTVCLFLKTQGAGREHHLFFLWRLEARRRPASDTEVPIGTSSSVHALGRVSQPADSTVLQRDARPVPCGP